MNKATNKRGVRRILSAGAGMVLAAGAAPPVSAGAAPADTEPVLWSGVLRDGAGTPQRGTVTAFIRPPASFNAAGKDGGLPPVVLDSGEVGSDGHFSLRSAMPTDVPALYKQDGFLNVMVFAIGDDGTWAVATDTMHWRPADGGAWFSSVASLERANSDAASARNDAAASRRVATVRAADEAAAAEYRDITLTEPPSADVARAAARAPGSPYVGCTMLYTEATAKGWRTVAQIDAGKDWEYPLRYKRTNTSAWEVGYGTGTSGPWSIAGTASFSQYQSVGFNTSVRVHADYKRDTYQVYLDHDRIRWRCGTASNPGPYYVYTVEPRSWDGQTRNTEQGDNIPCNDNYKHSVAGGTEFYREDGASAKYQLGGSVFGFTGKATVTNDVSTRHGYTNHQSGSRFLCGESGSPLTGRTRVEAIA